MTVQLGIVFHCTSSVLSEFAMNVDFYIERKQNEPILSYELDNLPPPQNRLPSKFRCEFDTELIPLFISHSCYTTTEANSGNSFTYHLFFLTTRITPQRISITHTIHLLQMFTTLEPKRPKQAAPIIRILNSIHVRRPSGGDSLLC